jgi:hypothetical protein
MFKVNPDGIATGIFSAPLFGKYLEILIRSFFSSDKDVLSVFIKTFR